MSMRTSWIRASTVRGGGVWWSSRSRHRRADRRRGSSRASSGSLGDLMALSGVVPDSERVAHVQASLVLRRGAVGWQDAVQRDRAIAPASEGLTVAVCTYRRPASVTRFLTSLALQERIPDRLVIVDASPDSDTEAAVRRHPAAAAVNETRYVRVSGPLRGLTRQRNVALRLVETDLVAFFDDDVVLLAGCLAELE